MGCHDLGCGLGYPILTLCLFPYYFGGITEFDRFKPSTCYKIYDSSEVIFSAASMYLLAKNFGERTKIGLISAILYLLSPYHALDIYVREILERFGHAFIPLIFYGLWKLIKEQK